MAETTSTKEASEKRGLQSAVIRQCRANGIHDPQSGAIRDQPAAYSQGHIMPETN